MLTPLKTVADILDTLRTAPPPQQKSNKTGQALLPSAGPLNLLPLSPIQYLTSVLDSLAPLIKIRQQKGIAGGGKSLPIPVPIGVKLRRRTALKWILGNADKRMETKLADRVSREIINVAEGSSSAWEKRQAIHRMAVTSRVNVKVLTIGPRRSYR
jgi:small subunit ribosomal protein S7